MPQLIIALQTLALNWPTPLPLGAWILTKTTTMEMPAGIAFMQKSH